jgi:hypothetical protein
METILLPNKNLGFIVSAQIVDFLSLHTSGLSRGIKPVSVVLSLSLYDFISDEKINREAKAIAERCLPDNNSR